MSTVFTGTLSDSPYANQKGIQATSNGNRFTLEWYNSGGSYTLGLFISTDGGTTWSLLTTITSGGSYTSAGFHISADDYIHIAYNNANNGYLYYTRGTPNVARTSYSFDINMGVSDDSNQWPDICAHADPSTPGQTLVHIVGGSRIAANANCASYYRYAIPSGSTSPVSQSQLGLNTSGTTQGRSFPNIDFRHTGDGRTVAGGSPDVFVSWSSSSGLYAIKGTYSAGSYTFGSPVSIDSTKSVRQTNPLQDWLTAFFDGTRYVMVSGSLNAGAAAAIYERDAADTTTTSRSGLAISANGAASFDSAGNIYTVGSAGSTGSTSPLTVQKWTRATSTAAVLTTTPISSYPIPGTRRNAQLGAFDYVYGGSGSRYFSSIILNTAPNAPTPTAPANGASIDRTVAQALAWTFSDPDAGDSESAYDLQYRVQGTTTWTTVSATTTATSSTFAANFFTAGATYEWQVRSYDSQGAVGPWSSSSFFTAVNPPAAPTITAPASGATISAATSTVTWSAPSQAHYEVLRVADDGSGNPVPGTVYYDSGDVVDSTSRALSVAFPTNSRTEHVRVRVQVSGIWSPYADAKVLVSYTPPATPTVALTPLQATASLLIAITNPAPGGGQPAIDHNDIAVNDGAGLTRRATGIANNGTWTYMLPVSGRDYTAGNVQVTALATNGTTTTGSS